MRKWSELYIPFPGRTRLTAQTSSQEQIALQSITVRFEPGASRSPRRIALWLFAVFQFFYLLTSSGRVRTPDEYNTLYTTESLVLHGTTAVPQAVALHNFYGRLDVHGQPRAAYPPGQALLVAPWYALGQYVIGKLPGVPADDLDLVVAFATCLSSATFAALAVMFFFLLLIGVGIPLRSALIASGIVGLATPLFAYSAYLFSEPLTTAIFTGVAWLLFVRENSGELISARTAAMAGLILGFATIVRPTCVVAVAVFGLSVLVRDGKSGLRAALLLGAASAVGIAMLLAHNTVLFGGALTFGYPTMAEGAKKLNGFETPFFHGLYGFLFSPGKSVFFFAPVIVLAFLGLRSLWRRERGLASVAVMLPVAYLLFFAKYTQWEGGYCVGPRYLVPGIVLLCLGLGPVLATERPGVKVLAAVLFAVGFAVQALSLATSFMEDQVPHGHYYDAHWNYQMGYSLAGTVRLFFKYLESGEPAKLGLGWDRWLVFLAKGGISRGTLAALACVMLAGLVGSLVGLFRSMRPASAS